MIKRIIKKILPPVLLKLYHYTLALMGAVFFWFPSRKLVVIGVTGTSGKSTTVDFITRILEEAGNKVASMSSIRFKVGEEERKNQLKMTMPGRFRVQKFLKQAVKARCKFAVLEVTSEGIKQSRHKFINFDTAVFTNLSPEHIESHGSFENYRNEKLKLFKATKNSHIVNIDDESSKYFLDIPANEIFTFGIQNAKQQHPYKLEFVRMLLAEDVNGRSFSINGKHFNLNLLGDFNVYNALAAIAVASKYGISLETCKKALEKVQGIPGRMEVISRNPLIVVDYAHTPDQLEKVYQTLLHPIPYALNPNLICVLGSCGGGRDKWKRPVLGKIAAKYCKEVIVTNEDPYDENPMDIINQVSDGVGNKAQKILDRKEAIKKAIGLAKDGDVVIITGKGSETLMCLENGKKIPWDDKEVVRESFP